MATNLSTNYQAAMKRTLSEKVLPITQRYLVARQFATPVKIPKGSGVTWTATRFNPLPLPAAPLSEAVAPVGEQLQISQVTGVALQWGDKITLSDVAVVTTMFDLIEQSKTQLGIQLGRLMERNAFAALLGATQGNYVNSRGSRASLVAGDVMDVATLNRTYADLENIGAPFYNGTLEPNVKRSIDHGAGASQKGPQAADHFVAIVSPFVEQDLRQNPQIVQAWSYSDVTRLYINEIGYYAGIHMTKSNMTPRWTGHATTGSASAGTAGSLATNTYYTIITGTDSLGYYGESQVYAVDAGTSVTGPTGSISITVPSTAGYTYSVYIGTTTSPTNLATATATAANGIPTTGVLAGQATNITPGQTVVLTGTGLYQVPPAAPASGVTVYRSYVFGKDYWAATVLENVSWTSLFEADKSDPLNQLRVVGYKFFEGFVITNQQFGAFIESSVSNTGAFG